MGTVDLWILMRFELLFIFDIFELHTLFLLQPLLSHQHKVNSGMAFWHKFKLWHGCLVGWLVWYHRGKFNIYDYYNTSQTCVKRPYKTNQSMNDCSAKSTSTQPAFVVVLSLQLSIQVFHGPNHIDITRTSPY